MTSPILIYFGRLNLFQMCHLDTDHGCGMTSRIDFTTVDPRLDIMAERPPPDPLQPLHDVVRAFQIPDSPTLSAQVELLSVHGDGAFDTVLRRSLEGAWRTRRWLEKNSGFSQGDGQLAAQNSPQRRPTRPFGCGFDYIDQAPSGESVGGVLFACHPLPPGSTNRFFDRLSGSRHALAGWHPGWAANIRAATERVLAEEGVGGLEVNLVDALVHLTDSHGPAFARAATNALKFGLPLGMPK